MDGSDSIRVLLVGNSPQSFSLIRRVLEKARCECHFASSLEAVKNPLRLWQFRSWPSCCLFELGAVDAYSQMAFGRAEARLVLRFD